MATRKLIYECFVCKRNGFSDLENMTKLEPIDMLTKMMNISKCGMVLAGDWIMLDLC